MIHALQRLLSRMPRWVLALFCLGLVGVIGTIDHATGHEVSKSIFYLLPIGIASWYGNRIMGLAAALVAALVWLVVDLVAEQHYSYAVIPYWNTIVRLGFYSIVAHLLAAQHRHLTYLKQSATTDALTGLRNTSGFIADAQFLWDLGARYRHTATLAYLDLDNFKRVNDAHGHAAGDAILQAVARVLTENLRHTDVIGRLGGDEFAALLPETSLDSAAVVLDNVRNRVLAKAQEQGWPITVSIGAVAVRFPYPSLKQAIHAADQLMYRSKQASKNRVITEEFQDVS